MQEELDTGIRNRAVAATNMNAESSRSHAIFTIHVRQRRIVGAQASAGCAQRVLRVSVKALCLHLL